MEHTQRDHRADHATTAAGDAPTREDAAPLARLLANPRRTRRA